MIPKWKKDLINKVLSEKNNKKINFVHIPKCGGTSLNNAFSRYNINCLGHNFAIPNEINFSIIRNPVERFESSLNYRLQEEGPRGDWPQRLAYVYNDKNVDLNYIVSELTSYEISNFYPYKTIYYWSNNIDFFLRIDEASEFLKLLGYDNIEIPVTNVSTKNRGYFNNLSVDKINTIFSGDIVFYNKWCGK